MYSVLNKYKINELNWKGNLRKSRITIIKRGEAGLLAPIKKFNEIMKEQTSINHVYTLHTGILCTTSWASIPNITEAKFSRDKKRTSHNSVADHFSMYRAKQQKFREKKLEVEKEKINILKDAMAQHKLLIEMLLANDNTSDKK